MNCILCNQSLESLPFFVKDRKIIECNQCKIAYTDSRQENVKQNKKVILNSIYNFFNYKKRLDIIDNRFLFIISQLHRFKIKGRLLDIGGGFGRFCYLISQRTEFKPTLLEPYLTNYYKSSRIRTIKMKLLDFIRLKRSKYDVICLLDVLEHFNNPSVILQECHKLINKEGILVIQVPNYTSIMAKVCKDWSWWMIEDHKVHFSVKSLTILLKQNGYKIRYCSTYESIHDFIKNLDGNFSYVDNEFIRKGYKVLIYSTLGLIYLILRPIFWRLGYGGLILLIAES